MSTSALPVELLRRCPELERIAHRWPPRRIPERGSGFEDLVHVVVEQAVSLASAAAVWRRIRGAFGSLAPTALVEAGPRLRDLGLSQSKADCIVSLARAVEAGRLALDELERAPDEEVRRVLTALPGIGRWTADVYLLLGLKRPDVWPAHDLAIRVAVKEVAGLPARPTIGETEAWGARAKPQRSLAALLLWEDYLARREAAARPRRAPPQRGARRTTRGR